MHGKFKRQVGVIWTPPYLWTLPHREMYCYVNQSLESIVCLQVYVNIVISASFWIDNSKIFVTGLNLTTRPESPLKSTVGPYYPNIGVIWTPLTYDLLCQLA